MWSKNVHYCRLDGSTGSADRDRLINAFNSPSNKEMWVFLLSTRAGCLGINLIGANRVIVLDVSWNPCYDAQAVCRVYRYGQTKPCHIYRLVCDGTMERKIYDRQISKQGMADRVVDELQPERHFTADEIITLLRPLANLPEPQDLSFGASLFRNDQVLFILCQHFGPLLTKLPFRHESLLLDSANERMTDVEKFYAMRGFQQDWNARKRNTTPQLSVQRNSPVSPQPRQPGVPPPAPAPTVAQTTSSLSLSPYSNTRVGLPSATPSPNPPTHSMQSHSGTNFASQQFSHSSIPMTSSVGMGHGNMTTMIPDRGDIICLDSDSEVDWNQAQTTRHAGAPVGIHQMTSSQATLLPGPKVLTVPISPTLDSTHASSGPTHFPASHTSSAPTGSPPFNAAVAQLMAFLRQREMSGNRGDGSSSVSPSQTHFTTPTSASTAQQSSSLSQGPLPSAREQFGSVGQQSLQPPVMNQQVSVAGQAHSTTGSHMSASSTAPGQLLGQPSLNSRHLTSIVGQTTLPGQPTSTLGVQTDVNRQMGIGFPTHPTDLITAATSHPVYSSRLSSLLQGTKEMVSSLQTSQKALTLNTGVPVSSQAVALSQHAQTSSTSHMSHELSSSPPRPLFSPPKLPLSREATLISSHSVPVPCSALHSTRAASHAAPNTITAAVSQSQISSPSPPAPLTSPHPPPSSHPHSPSTVLTPSPLSQPPTPSTSIPLLSPVAAHFFHVSMSKSPKPSPSPGHTPTPSPSPSSHHQPITSPPLCSPPSVSMGMCPAEKNTNNTSAHSGFHSNTALNCDKPSGPHSNLSSYGNSCIILR